MIDYQRLQADLRNGLDTYLALSSKMARSGLPARVPIKIWEDNNKSPNPNFKIVIGNNGQVGSLISLDGGPEGMNYEEWALEVNKIWQPILDARKVRA